MRYVLTKRTDSCLLCGQAGVGWAVAGTGVWCTAKLEARLEAARLSLLSHQPLVPGSPPVLQQEPGDS